MWYTSDFNDYELLDTSDGERLERWKDILLIRPDPQVLWKNVRRHPLWSKANAHYHRSAKGGGSWEIKHLNDDLLNKGWRIDRKKMSFCVRPTGFKHTGVFPEQAVNWDFITEKIEKANRPVSVLNLFAYTGGATLAAASAGASVCHVDASKALSHGQRKTRRFRDLATRRSATLWTTAKNLSSASFGAATHTMPLLWIRRPTAEDRAVKYGSLRTAWMSLLRLLPGFFRTTRCLCSSIPIRQAFPRQPWVIY